MIKKIFITVLLLVVLYCFLNPIVIQLQETNSNENTFSNNKTFVLKELFRGNKKKYKAYIVFNYEEIKIFISKNYKEQNISV